MDHVVAQGLDIAAATADSLRCFSILDSNKVLQGLEQELPNYLTVIADVVLATAEDKLKWWSWQQGLPNWSNVLQKLLVQPSSAASEKAFSLLAHLFSDEQERALRTTLSLP